MKALVTGGFWILQRKTELAIRSRVYGLLPRFMQGKYRGRHIRWRRRAEITACLEA